MPFGLALLALGFSYTASGPLTLPFDLSVIGMTGCNLFAGPVATNTVAGAGSTVTWSLTVPANPTLLGAVIYGQGFPLDPTANAFGFTATNGARIKIGNQAKRETARVRARVGRSCSAPRVPPFPSAARDPSVTCSPPEVIP